MTDTRPKKGGYILIETLTAMAVLSISVLAINGAMRQAAITNALARDYTHARFVLEQVVASVELKPVIRARSESGRYSGELSHYRWEYEVDLVEMPVPSVSVNPDNPAHAELLRRVAEEGSQLELPVQRIPRITARVSWQRGGIEFTETVQTLMEPGRLPEDPS